VNEWFKVDSGVQEHSTALSKMKRNKPFGTFSGFWRMASKAERDVCVACVAGLRAWRGRDVETRGSWMGPHPSHIPEYKAPPLL
jgi:hypothetical protein